MDDQRVCAVCRKFEQEKERVERYFGTQDALARILADAKARAQGEQDCLMLLSGGKDSTYALCRIVEMGANPLVFMLDNGYISEEAKENGRRICDLLGLELVIQRPPGMGEIFRDSLARFSNVCEGCFKTIYTLAVNVAVERGIETIVTGLSRGQIFETRLQDLYRRGIDDPDEVERTILAARKAYHRMDDAVYRNLDVGLFETDETLDRVRFVDFYRYCDDTVDTVMDYIGRETPWIRTGDQGRSTTCLIKEVGIYAHRTERGFHNDAMSRSWDVRLGHRTREEAAHELDEELDAANIRRILDEIEYTVQAPATPELRLVACYAADRDVPVNELRAYLGERLAAEAIPSAFIRVDALPTTAAGKVDFDALPRPSSNRPVLGEAYVAPRNEKEAALCVLWSDILGIGLVGVHDNFFEIGGDSMHCIQIVSAAMELGLSFAPRDLFTNPTIAELAAVVAEGGEDAAPEAATVSRDELADLVSEFGEF